MALPKDPRQLMINLMYLVLTAMLALNITKEVLTAFQTINTSIETSVSSINGKNNEVYDKFEKLYANNDTKAKAEVYRNQALEVKAKTQEVITFLQNFKDTVISLSGGWEEEGGKKEMKGLDNIDVSTKLFVEEKKGDVLKQKLNDYKNFLSSIVKPEYKDAIAKSIPIQLADMPHTDENPNGDWAYGTFHNIPVVATVAMLSKFQSDVKNSEALVLDNLIQQVGIDDWKFDEVKAIATPKTSYALEGQEIEATIILAAYNKTMVTNMGPGVTVDKGVGTMKFKASGIGLQTRKGTITVPKGGEMKSYPYEFNYMVGTAGASLQLDKMNVMYIGVKNPVTLSASGYNIEDVSISFSDPTAVAEKNGKGTYNVSVAKNGNLQYTIFGKSRDGSGNAKIASGVIRVKYFPDPTATVAGKVSGLVNTAVFKAQPGVLAKLDSDFETMFKVTNFRFMYQPRVGDLQIVDVAGNRFNEACQVIMQRARAGDRVFFEGIKAVGPDKKVRSINPIVLTLN